MSFNQFILKEQYEKVKGLGHRLELMKNRLHEIFNLRRAETPEQAFWRKMPTGYYYDWQPSFLSGDSMKNGNYLKEEIISGKDNYCSNRKL